MASGEGNIVPIVKGVIDNERINRLKDFFQQHFTKLPSFIVRVPGRVNLIGEHIDYCGYGVCPMALQQDILLAVSKEEAGKIVLVNTNNKYEKHVLDAEFSGGARPEWYHYFWCGFKGARETLTEVVLSGMNVAVDGNIPPSAGLSSSSALVSGAALSTFYVNGHLPIKEKIADLCARAERYIGTQGGGMDQAIAFLATEGCGKFIEFSPLRATDVKLPEDAVFVIAHSLVEKNKAASNDFNCRVVECRLAAQVLARKKELQWKDVKKLSDVQRLLGENVDGMVKMVHKVLHQESYVIVEIAEILGVSVQDIEEFSLTKDTRDVRDFKLFQRALHVFSEARRVEKFKHACEQGTAGNAVLVELGRLMIESHESLRDLYEASHPNLDRIVEISRNFTFGCRLTGAGWGGCTVALTNPERVKDYIDALKNDYYSKLGVVDSELGSFVFSTAPHSGACIYQ